MWASRSRTATAEAVEPFAYYQLVRDSQPPPGDSKMVPTFSGVEVYTEKEKLAQSILRRHRQRTRRAIPKTATDGWIAVVQHYFLGAWLPRPGVQREYLCAWPGQRLIRRGRHRAGRALGTGPDGHRRRPNSMPARKSRKRLESLAPGLELTVDYGWLRVLAVPLFWVLSEIHDVVGQLGRGDHFAHGDHQARVLSAVCRQL